MVKTVLFFFKTCFALPYLRLIYSSSCPPSSCGRNGGLSLIIYIHSNLVLICTPTIMYSTPEPPLFYAISHNFVINMIVIGKYARLLITRSICFFFVFCCCFFWSFVSWRFWRLGDHDNERKGFGAEIGNESWG
jgi:hypothetical protein